MLFNPEGVTLSIIHLNEYFLPQISIHGKIVRFVLISRTTIETAIIGFTN